MKAPPATRTKCGLLIGLVWAGLLLDGAPTTRSEPVLPLVQAMPAHPEHWRMLDWRQRARDFDDVAFDEKLRGEQLPLLTWADGGKKGFLIPGSIGNGTGGEAICTIASVISGGLTGIDKTNDRGRNWVELCDAWFSPPDGVVMNNLKARNNGRSFWYVVLPGVLYSQLALQHPDAESLSEHLRLMAARYRKVVEALGGAEANFNHTGFDFEKNQPVDNGRWKEPDAAAGIAYILYAAWTRWHDPRHLEAARWCLDFLERRQPSEGNPLYETLLYYAPALAAKLNAEHGTHYDVAKLVNWCLSPNEQASSARPGWGVVARKFGQVEVHGLQGSTKAGQGYVFAMNSFNAAAALAPLARYDTQYAPALGKWLTHLANNARLFFPDEMPAEQQSCPRFRSSILKAVPYEGLREKAVAVPEWKFVRMESGSAEPDVDQKLHRPHGANARLQADADGRLALLIEVALPAECEAGAWQLGARIRNDGGAYLIKTALKPEGPWQGSGGFKRPAGPAGASLVAGGPLLGARGAGSLWLKIQAVGQHDSGELLTLDFLRLQATTSAGPYASGDSFSRGHGPTDLATYGGAYIGYLGAMVRRTEHDRVLAFDLGATDFLSPAPGRVWLCYNADTQPRTVTFPGADAVTIPSVGAAVVRSGAKTTAR